MFEDRQVDPTEFEQVAKRELKKLNTLQTSAGTPETHKKGIYIILREILSGYSGEQNPKHAKKPNLPQFRIRV